MYLCVLLYLILFCNFLLILLLCKIIWIGDILKLILHPTKWDE